MKNIKKIMAVLSAAALVFAMGCNNEKGSTENNIVYYDGSSNEYSQAAEGYENSRGEIVKEEELVQNIPTTPVNIGEQARVSGIDLKVTNLYDAGTVGASDETLNYDRQILMLECEVTNNTDETVTVNAFDMRIRFMDGEETDITTDLEAISAATGKVSGLESLNAKLRPGQTASGYVAFSVYSKWESMTVYFNPSVTVTKDALALDITQDMVEKLES